jgi:hypothetical protein
MARKNGPRVLVVDNVAANPAGLPLRDVLLRRNQFHYGEVGDAVSDLEEHVVQNLEEVISRSLFPPEGNFLGSAVLRTRRPLQCNPYLGLANGSWLTFSCPK